MELFKKYPASSCPDLSPQRLLGILFTLAAIAPAFGQLHPIQVRFEAGCDGVKAYFTNAQPEMGQHWDLGTGSTSTALHPVALYPYGASTIVSLTLTYSNGDQHTFVREITTPPPVDLTELQFPNIFTPNGDGVNDLFGPITEQILGPCCEMSIFDRFGHRIFYSDGNGALWDGRSMAGEMAIEGNYFYIFKVNGKAFTGNFQLSR